MSPFGQRANNDDFPRRMNPRVRNREHDDPEHTTNHHRLELEFKVDIPEFDGRLDLDKFSDWILAVERVLDFKEVPPDRIIKLVAIKLT